MCESNLNGHRVLACCLAAMLVWTPATMSGQGAPAGGPPPAGGAAPAPGQGRGGPGPGAPGGGQGGRGGGAAAARTAAPLDLTGYWVSIVTEDWIERMAPDSPPSGTGGGLGGFGGGRGGGGGRAGGPPATTPADPCRAYGAGGSMRLPGRLNITWADDNTLKVDLDAGTQTRLFRFNAPPASGPRTLQGYSVATWEGGGGGGRGGGGGGGGFGGGPGGPAGGPGATAAPGGRGGAAAGGRGGAAAAAPRWASLRVVTTNMTGGYLLTSRNAYSENATLTEHFTRHMDFGVEYLTVTAVIDDGGQRIVSSTFKKEPNGSKFSPSGCEVVR